MTILAFPTPYTPFRGFANDGSPLAGGLLWSYAAGTNTPLVTYQDPGASSPNTNPTVLNSRGEAPVFTLPNVAYKFLLTDSIGNTIPGWPIDNVVLFQLITLYGGVDTGVANAYVLNFSASFSSLTNGIVIYWVPANTNSGASTINVNSLGVVNIVNPDGSALLASQILSGQPLQMMYYNGSFILLNGSFVGTLVVSGQLSTGNAALGNVTNHTLTGYGVVAAAQVDMSVDKGSFSATFLGCTVPIVISVSWFRIGSQVFMTLPIVGGTSNVNTFSMTGLPAAITPVTGGFGNLVSAEDNSVVLDSSNGIQFVATNAGTLGFYKNHSQTGWTNGGTKGTSAIQFISYSLT